MIPVVAVLKIVNAVQSVAVGLEMHLQVLELTTVVKRVYDFGNAHFPASCEGRLED